MKKKTIEQLLEDFAQNVAAETDAAFFKANAKLANKHAKQVAAIFRKLKTHGDNGREALSTLFTHPRMDVRVAAAVYLLRYKTVEAKAVLQEAAKGEGLVPFEAQEALKRWEEGTWALDPAPEKQNDE